MKLLGTYPNGNYAVTLFDDGTKIRSNDLDNLIPEKPESMDILITKRCEMGCPMCHEDAMKTGLHGDILNAPFLDTLLPYTELAIGGGNPLSHPDLLQFLLRCKERNLIANMTVHEHHFLQYRGLLKYLTEQKLLHGLGVSVHAYEPGIIAALQEFPNAVVHVINGVIPTYVLRCLYDHGLKLLILGYKDFRRGAAAHSCTTDLKMKSLYEKLPELVQHFQVVSFDNLAIRQLDPKRLLSNQQWNTCYMGDDGQYTMYIDMVNRQFARSSTATERWPLLDDIKPMFDKVRSERNLQ